MIFLLFGGAEPFGLYVEKYRGVVEISGNSAGEGAILELERMPFFLNAFECLMVIVTPSTPQSYLHGTVDAIF